MRKKKYFYLKPKISQSKILPSVFLSKKYQKILNEEDIFYLAAVFRW